MDYVARSAPVVRRERPVCGLATMTSRGHQCLNIYGWMEVSLVCVGRNNIDLSIEVQGLIQHKGVFMAQVILLARLSG